MYINRVVLVISTFFLSYSLTVGQNIVDSLSFNYENGFIIVEANVNNNSYNFLFDTGAKTSITPDVINDLKLKPIALEPFKKYLINLYLTPQIIKQKFKIKEIDFYLKSIANGGIIGYDFFEDRIFRIDYKKKRIYFLDSMKKENVNQVAFSYNFYSNPQGVIKINDIDIKICFDTGFSNKSGLGISISQKTLNNIQIDTTSLFQFEYFSEIRKILIKKIYFYATIHIGNKILDNYKIGIQNKFNINLLGNCFFEQYIVTFDFKNNIFYFE